MILYHEPCGSPAQIKRGDKIRFDKSTHRYQFKFEQSTTVVHSDVVDEDIKASVFLSYLPKGMGVLRETDLAVITTGTVALAT
jgi:hypothetical protein